jgi:hypothetical protein
MISVRCRLSFDYSDKSELDIFFIFISLVDVKNEMEGRRITANRRMEENQTNILSLPERNRGKHTQKFKVLSITTNHFQVSVKENLKQIFIFSVKFDPRIPSDNTKLRR